jgi:glycosyltransferase involved in cell wall biosynthesis
MAVSIIIPLYNKAPYICRALSSVLRQTIQDFECIVVDDGSTDGSGDIVKGINDLRIRLVRQPNGGVSRARNKGIELARNPLVAFLDADDEWMPGFLEASLRMHESHPYITACFSNYVRASVPCPTFSQDSQGPRVVADYFAFCLSNAGLGMWTSTVTARHDVLLEIGGFPVGRTMGEDLDTWARLAWSGRIGYIPSVLATYHFEEGACAQSIRDAVQGKDEVFRDILETYLAWSRAGLVPPCLAESSEAYVYFMRILDIYAVLGLGRPDLARILYSGLPRWQRYSVSALCGYLALSIPCACRPLSGLGRRFATLLSARRWRETNSVASARPMVANALPSGALQGGLS